MRAVRTAVALLLALVAVGAASAEPASNETRPGRFPPNFLFGAATAAYQVEGAAFEGGRGLSIWDEFSHLQGKVFNNDHGDVAVDQYHRYEADIAMMKSMGLKVYRFSISWSRILPNGTLPVNQVAIDYYSSFINALLEADIVPFVTLYHWDLPIALHYQLGGWLNSDISTHFQQYADVCFKAFGDRVKHWITFNEPWAFAWLGYGLGSHAPGRCSDRARCAAGDSAREPYVVGHNVLLAHAHAVKLYRTKYASQQGRIGITLNCDWTTPLTSRDEDVAAAQRGVEFQLGWFADPIFLGDYPASMKAWIGDRLPEFTDSEKKLLHGSHDFFGLNHYSTSFAYASNDTVATFTDADPNLSSRPPLAGWLYDRGLKTTFVGTDGQLIGPKADCTWHAVVPWGFGKLLRWIHHRYNAPSIFITENGVAVPNESALSLKDALNDNFRVNFYRSYLRAMSDAMASGVRVEGYMAWSFLDNFEWADGYNKRFGMVYVDYKNGLTRHPKASSRWYSKLIQRRRL
jgi:beta-glucosidase/6-phospho-beta-glucosidase/beta-galactosidase